MSKLIFTFKPQNKSDKLKAKMLEKLFNYDLKDFGYHEFVIDLSIYGTKNSCINSKIKDND